MKQGQQIVSNQTLLARLSASAVDGRVCAGQVPGSVRQTLKNRGVDWKKAAVGLGLEVVLKAESDVAKLNREEYISMLLKTQNLKEVAHRFNFTTERASQIAKRLGMKKVWVKE